MREFETPAPISVVTELVMADVQVLASDRPNTAVEVYPSDPERQADVNAADQVRVEYAGGRLLVKSTGRWRSWSPFGYGGSIEVRIALPTGSQVNGVAVGAFRCTGALGDCEIKTSIGDIQVEQAADARLVTSAGDIHLGRATGNAELVAASGEIRVGDVDGTVEIKNSNGDTHVGQVRGELRVKAANGDIAIGRVRASLTAKTAMGDIRVGAVGTGSVVAETRLGTLEIGVPSGIAAWLDLHTEYGQLHNGLEAAEAPPSSDDVVRVRARTGYGDITVRRWHPAASPDDAGQPARPQTGEPR